MSTPLILCPNRIDEATLSGGSWEMANPLAKLQNRRLKAVARSTSLVKAYTQLLITLPAPRRIKALALVNANLDPTATWRIRAGTDLRTNTLLRSEALDNAAWTKTRLTVSADAALAGDGLQTLDRLIESTDNDTHEVSQEVADLAPDQTLYGSVELKANGRNAQLEIADPDSGGNYVRCNFDLSAGTVGTAANGGNGTGAAGTIESLGGGNYRCTLSGTPNSSGADSRFTVRLLSGTTASYTGDGAQGVHAGKADLGTAPGYYVATTTAAAAGPDLRLYDSGSANVYPVVYPANAVEWEDDAFFTGRPTAEDWENLVQQAVHIVESGVLTNGQDLGIYATHWLVELADAANAAGHVDIGRVFLGGAWQPTRHAGEGVILGAVHPTITDVALNGAESYDPIAARRSVALRFDQLSRAEGFAGALALQRKAGVHREIFFIFNPADATNLLRTSMLCRQEAVAETGLPTGLGGSDGTVTDVSPSFRLVELVA